MSTLEQPPGGDRPAIRWTIGKWSLALALVGTLAFLLRWYYVSHAVVYHPIRGDAIQYHAYAWNLVQHGVFSMAQPGSATVMPDSFRDPGYPLFLAGWMVATGSFDGWYAAVLMSQSLLGALTVVLLMSAARGWIRDGWLVGAGVLMAIWPHSITITSFVLSETLFGFLAALAFWLWNVGLHRESWRWTSAAGITFGLAGLTNAVLLPFAPLLAAFLVVRRRLSWRIGLTLVVGALLLPATWGVRNLQLPSGASSGGRALINLVQGSWPEYHSGYRLAVDGRPEGARIMRAIGQEQDLMLADPGAGLQRMVARMSEAPMRYFGWYLGKPALLWDWSIRMGQGDIYVYLTLNSPFAENPAWRALVSLCRALNPLLMVLALVGTVLTMRKKSPNTIGRSVALLVLFVTLVYAVLQSEPRYSIPFRGFECLLACYALDKLVGWLEHRNGPSESMTQPQA
ncbi:hypothetical protein [Fulvimonas yonginensis]|uniref:Glycosyltransferase RgtA/B/C/D-like domain-containing protein n=1 Tax=Fulvimonas yonginensis TaxID=1495200 RepID=A0ABU8JA16_9GAMM